MPSPVPEDCLQCMCLALSSRCQMPHPVCSFDVISLLCGPYRIDEPYWIDARLRAGDLKGSWQQCSSDVTCSKNTVQGYMARYAVSSRLGHPPTCEDFARIHVGGPNGFKSSSTLNFWLQVKECLDL
ncbi:invertebrate-type lysozyme-like [Diadema antillarum]|uniref:invertebrate-type lysozyme-like n=1 Tax=Diadema antillarum TaxID=105358 RepID=UPI003A878183